METNSGSGWAAFGRVIWMIAGPGLLFVLGCMIATEGGGWVTSRDIAFFIVLAAMIFGRYLEFRGGDPRTLTGEKATSALSQSRHAPGSWHGC